MPHRLTDARASFRSNSTIGEEAPDVDRGDGTVIAPSRATAVAGRTRDFLGFIGPGGLVTQPALDGVRGLAIAAVLTFHVHGYWLPAGNLGVSVFFVLSGFLISTVIMQNIERHGRFVATTFWAARSRRILPALLVTLGLISVLRVTTNAFIFTGRFDTVATALQVNNWYFIAREPTGAEILGFFPAVLHLWSLSVEEQFYAGIAILAFAASRWSGNVLATIRWMSASLAVTSFALPLAFRLDTQHVYIGTDTRAGELLVGVWLSSFLFRRSSRERLLAHRNIGAVAGAISLAGVVVLFRFADPFDVGRRDWILPAIATLTAGTIVGCLLPTSPTSTLLRFAPLRWLGRISYGAYLIHVPIGLAADQWFDVGWIARSLIVVVTTLVLAEASYRFVEMPIRRGRAPVSVLIVGGAVLVTVIAGSAFVA